LADTQKLDSGAQSTIEHDLRPKQILRYTESKRKSMEPKQSSVVDSLQYKFSAWEAEQVKQRNKTLIAQFH